MKASRRFRGTLKALTDPALYWVYIHKAGPYAREKWPRDPSSGSFGAWLENARRQFYESDESRALLVEMGTLFFPKG